MSNKTYSSIRTYSSSRRMAQELAEQRGITIVQAIDQALFEALQNDKITADFSQYNGHEMAESEYKNLMALENEQRRRANEAFPGYDYAPDN